MFSGIDTRAAEKKLQRKFGKLPGAYGDPREVSDEWRLLDLTAVISEQDRSILYHRLDWAYVSVSPSWGLFRFGRQAITWVTAFCLIQWICSAHSLLRTSFVIIKWARIWPFSNPPFRTGQSCNWCACLEGIRLLTEWNGIPLLWGKAARGQGHP